MELTGISIFYFVCVAFGFLFALVTVVFGELGAHIGDHGVEVGHPGAEVGVGHDADVGHDVGAGHDVGPGHGDVIGISAEAQHMPQASVLNTLTVLVFIAFFGLAGLFAVWVLRLPPVPSLAFALPVGLIASAAEFVLYVKVFVKAQGSSEATMQEILGCEAEVITSIPAEHTGEVAYVIKGSRYNSPATSEEKEDLPSGTRVRVVNTQGGVLVVRAI
jgi:membrane protein implicated in regulation of membrane protease activity